MLKEIEIFRRLSIEAWQLLNEAASFLKEALEALSASLWRTRTDVIIATLLGAAAAAFAVWRFGYFDLAALSGDYNVWYGSDVKRVVAAAEDRRSRMHYRASVHPLYSLFVATPSVVMVNLGVTPQVALSAVVGAGAFLLVAAFYASARMLGLRRLDAIAGCALLLSTGSAMFWTAVPETFVFGGASMLIPLIWLAAPRTKYDLLTAPLQSAASLAMTVTNWMSGISAAAIALGLRRALHVSVLGLLIVVVLSIVQSAVFPLAGNLFKFNEEVSFVNTKDILERLASLRDVLLATTPTLSDTGVSFGAWGGQSYFWIAIAGWVALAVLAVKALMQRLLAPEITAFFLVNLAGQFLLHLVYGDSYFLYSLHFTPYLILLVLTPCLGGMRTVTLVAIAITALASFAHNLHQFNVGTEILNHLPATRP